MSNYFKYYENDVHIVLHLRMWKEVRNVRMTKRLTGLIGYLRTDLRSEGRELRHHRMVRNTVSCKTSL